MRLEKILSICTGCGACVNACPVHAITIREDENGFLKPVIDPVVCNDCGLCEKKCPLISPPFLIPPGSRPPRAYAAYNEDDAIRMQSSSGGIFDALAREILTAKGVVFGAAFDEELSVAQKAISCPEELPRLRFSKYVQSHTRDTFREVRDLLKAGRKILYTGTPCMIGGLLNFLGARHKDLFLCSVICDSVSSRKAWRLYLRYKEDQRKRKIREVCFRDKRFGWGVPAMSFAFEGLPGELSRRDWFRDGFSRHLFLNGAYLNCHFRGISQLADITLGDLWGIEEICPDLASEKKGVSVVLVNNSHGQELFDSCKERLWSRDISLEAVLCHQPSLTSSPAADTRREFLLEDLDKLPMHRIIRKYPFRDGLLLRAVKKIGRIAKKIVKRALRKD